MSICKVNGNAMVSFPVAPNMLEVQFQELVQAVETALTYRYPCLKPNNVNVTYMGLPITICKPIRKG